MIDFVAALAAHAREINPEFLIIPQNAVHIIDALEDEDHKRRDMYLETISAIAAEDLFFKGEKPENNAFNPDEEAIDALVRDFLDSGKPVLSGRLSEREEKGWQILHRSGREGFSSLRRARSRTQHHGPAV